MVQRWTPELDLKLDEMISKQMSANQIAHQFCMEGMLFSRNSVLGRAHRTGRTMAAMPNKPRPLPSKPASPSPDTPTDFPVIPIAPVPVVPPPQGNVTLLQLTDKTCRWPVGDPMLPEFAFCGDYPAEGRPYCQRCCRLAYQPAENRSKPFQTYPTYRR